MILKIVFYFITVIVHTIVWIFQSVLFTLFIKIFLSKSKVNRLISCEEKWEKRYILIMSFFAFVIWFGINQLWIYFIGQSIPYLLTLFLLLQVWYQHKSEKEKDFKGYLDGYNKSFNSDFSVGLRGIVKDVPGLSKDEMKLSGSQLEKLYFPSNIKIYSLRGLMYGIVLLIIYISMNSIYPTSYF